MYAERRSPIPGAVRWRTVGTAGTALILPDGCMDVIVVDGAPIVAGPDAVAAHVPGSDGARFDGLRFPPGMLPQLLGVSAGELVGRRVDLADVVPHRRVPRSADPEVIAAALLDGVDLDRRIGAVARSRRSRPRRDTPTRRTSRARSARSPASRRRGSAPPADRYQLMPGRRLSVLRARRRRP